MKKLAGMLVALVIALVGWGVLVVPFVLLWVELLLGGKTEIDQLAGDLANGEEFNAINSTTQYVEGLSKYVQDLVSRASLLATFTIVAATAVEFVLLIRAKTVYAHPVHSLGQGRRSGSLVDLSFDDGQWYGLVRTHHSSGDCAWFPLRLLSVRPRSRVLEDLRRNFKFGLLMGVLFSFVMSATLLITSAWIIPPALIGRGYEAITQAAPKLGSAEEARQLRVAAAQLIDMSEYPGLLYSGVLLVSGALAVVSGYPFRRRRFGTLALEYREDGSWRELGHFGTLTNDANRGWTFQWLDPIFSNGGQHIIPIEDAVPIEPLGRSRD